MPDATLPITGSDTKIELLINGAPASVIDSITRWSVRERSTYVETKPLGTDDVDIDKRPQGWEGEFEVARRNGQLDDFVNQLNLAIRNRVPQLILITHTDYYRDGTSRTFVYPDCKFTVGTESARESATSTRVTWMTGKDRI